VEYRVKRGFGKKREKEYFVVQVDGDTMSGVVAGPFESERQGRVAIDALRPLYSRQLQIIGGHLTGWHEISQAKRMWST